MNIIITAPSLDPKENVSGVSSVVRFIIDNNKAHHYIHFGLGKKDRERGGIYRVPSLLRALRAWRRLLNENPDALVHYSFPLSSASILRDPLFMWVARQKKMKMVLHVHGGLYLTAQKIPWIYRCILKKVFSMPVPFIALSEMEVELMKRNFGVRDVTAIPNCIDLREAKDFHRKKNEGTLTVGYIGRIAETKGMDYLLEACRRLKNEGVPFVMDLAGKEEQEGEYLPAFKKAMGEEFHYSGIVSEQSKVDYLKRIDVLALPSYFEGLPMSLLECMAYGVVPVTTPVGSIPQLVSDGENGLFIRVKDVDSIVAQVKRLNTDREKLMELGTRAQHTILEHFNTEDYIAQLNALYARTSIKGI